MLCSKLCSNINFSLVAETAVPSMSGNWLTEEGGGGGGLATQEDRAWQVGGGQEDSW